MKFNLKKNIALLITFVAISASSQETVTVDGVLDDAGWNHTFSVGFTFDDASTGLGFLALGTSDDGNQVLYYSVPKTYVDISYGKNAIGWDDYAHNGPHDCGHSYDELKGSDKLEFTTADGKEVKLELNGKLAGDSITISTATSLEYNRTLASFSENYSPELNGNNPDYTDDSDANYLTSSDPDWIFDVAYEIEFKAGTFDNDAWNLGDLASLFSVKTYKNHGEHGKIDIPFDSFFGGHASPSKLSVTTTTFTPCAQSPDVQCNTGTPPPSNDIPVPGTVWLTLLGLFALYRTRISV